MSELVANLAVAAALALAGVALLLAGVAFVSWRRVRHGRLAWIGVAFLVFAAQGIVFLGTALGDRTGDTWPVATLLSLGAVAALYVAVLR